MSSKTFNFFYFTNVNVRCTAKIKGLKTNVEILHPKYLKLSLIFPDDKTGDDNYSIHL